MSYDYYLECSICEQDVWCFSNSDKDPQFFEVLKFIMEHNFAHTGTELSFKILDQDTHLDKWVSIKCGDRPKPIEFEEVKFLDDIINFSVEYSDGSGYNYNPNGTRVD